MLKRMLSLALVGAVAAVLSGCYGTPVRPPVGNIYTDFRAPLFGGSEIGSKSGSAEVECYVGLIATGDCSFAAAARNGGITKITASDYAFFNVLGVYQRFTTVVHGE